MSFYLFILIGALSFLTFACGENTAPLSQIHTAVQNNTQAELRDSFEDCLISEFEKNHRTPFETIKASCHKKGLARCAGEKLCEQAFNEATHDLMKFSTSVDCDSGFCTVLY